MTAFLIPPRLWRNYIIKVNLYLGFHSNEVVYHKNENQKPPLRYIKDFTNILKCKSSHPMLLREKRCRKGFEL